LKHYINAQNMVVQLGNVFGKVFVCCLCLMEREYMSGALYVYFSNNNNNEVNMPSNNKLSSNNL
jgi:hypothetical protein